MTNEQLLQKSSPYLSIYANASSYARLKAQLQHPWSKSIGAQQEILMQN